MGGYRCPHSGLSDHTLETPCVLGTDCGYGRWAEKVRRMEGPSGPAPQEGRTSSDGRQLPCDCARMWGLRPRALGDRGRAVLFQPT